MAFPVSVGDIVEVRIRARQSGQQLLNVLHYKVSTGSSFDGAVDFEEALAIINDGTIGIITAYKAFANGDVFFSGMDMQLIYPTRYRSVSAAVGAFGLREGMAMPQNVQASVTRRVDEAGKSKTGRTELFGLITEDQEDGLLTLDAVTLASTLAGKMSQNIELVTGTLVFQPIIYSRSFPLTSNPVVGYRVQDSVRVARRRTVGVGK